MISIWGEAIGINMLQLWRFAKIHVFIISIVYHKDADNVCPFYISRVKTKVYPKVCRFFGPTFYCVNTTLGNNIFIR